MRPAILAAIVLVAAPAVAGGASTAGPFDLLCRGQLTRNGGAALPFETRLHVDAASRRFCLDACLEVFRLSELGARRLAYRYDVGVADADPAAGRYRGAAVSSGAGPFAQAEDIAVDRVTGAYRRDYRYRQGDPAARSFDDRYVGHCRAMPYSGLAVRAG